jgi:hypothetical protein
VDATGRPLADVRVAWLSDEEARALDAARARQRVFTRGGAAGRDARARDEDTTTTAEDGSFTLSPSADGRHVLGVVDHAWAGASAGETSSTVLVVPAVNLVVHVLDEHDAPIPRFQARVHEEHRGVGEGFDGVDGGFVVRWRRGPDDPAEVDARILVSAPGYGSESTAVRIPADRRSAEVTLRLRRVIEGTLVVRVTAPPRGFESVPIEVELRPPTTPDLVAERRPMAWSDARTLTATVPAGDWRLQVRLAHGWFRPLAWDGPATVVAARETEVTWVPPACGSLRVLAPAGAEVLLAEGDGSSGWSVGRDASGTVPWLPVGAYRVRCEGGTERRVDVREGAETLVTLTE